MESDLCGSTVKKPVRRRRFPWNWAGGSLVYKPRRRALIDRSIDRWWPNELEFAMTGNGIYNHILYCIIIQHLVDDSRQHITNSLNFSAAPIYYSFERYISRLIEVIRIVNMLV